MLGLCGQLGMWGFDLVFPLFAKEGTTKKKCGWVKNWGKFSGEIAFGLLQIATINLINVK